MAYNPVLDKRQLATGTSKGEIYLWDLDNLHEGAIRIPVTYATEDGVGVDTLAFSSDGNQLASGGKETIERWDLANNNNELPPIETGHKDWIWSIAYISDNTELASASTDNTVRLWDISSSSEAITYTTILTHDDGVTSIAYHPDREELATGSQDNKVYLTQVATLTNS